MMIFTIQNVPIKLNLKETSILSNLYLQYKMFLLNCQDCLEVSSEYEIYNTKCSY